MSKTDAIVRIFISSPGDVREEREQARLVVENLQQRYTDVKLETVLWEDLPLPATASFQETIDLLLKREPIDIAVFILWARLGSPLGPQITRPDGTGYRSGTEREFDLMLAAHEQSGEKKRPIIFAYTRDDNEEFVERLKSAPQSEWDEIISQSKLANEFIREHFRDAQGRNTRAYHIYPKPITFAQRLRLHLRTQLDEMLGVEMGQRWEDEPYRGLQCFDVQHGPIFKGRDRETCDLLERLESRSQAGCASVVIVGASGSGKSSLARAGVAATLQHEASEGGIKEWRVVAFTPGRGSEDLLGRLVRAIAAEFPECKASPQTLNDIAAALANDGPQKVVRIGLVPMFERAAEQAQGVVRLLLIVDQLEELWTDQRLAPEARKQFLEVIHALTCSGCVSVLMTLRSDFYPEAQQSEAFLALKEGRGHFDLLPPGTEVLNRMITEPARLAGLRFERDSKTGRMLDQEIAKGAARDHVALPLLQYALSELYQKRDPSRNLLTLAAYDQLGGLEGAIGRRAEKIFADLPAEVRASLPDVVRRLAVLREGSEEIFTAARAEMDHVATTAERRALIKAFVDARLLVVDQTESGATVGFAHEALLANWPRLAQLLEDDREFIRVRQRIKSAAHRWNEEQRSSDYLLPPGKPLAEGRDLLQRRRNDLDNESIEFVTRSIAWSESTRNVRRAIVITASLAFLLVCGISSVVFYFQKANADILRKKAQESEQLAQRNLALVRVNLAGHSWRMGDLRRARQHLQDTPPERRDWEWRYVKRLSEAHRLTIPVGKAGTSITWSPYGESLLSTWAAPKPTEIEQGKSDPGIGRLVLSQGIGARSEEGGIDVWEPANKRRLSRFGYPDGPTATGEFAWSQAAVRGASVPIISVSERTSMLGRSSSLVRGIGEPVGYEVQVWNEGESDPIRKLGLEAHFVSIRHDGYVAAATNNWDRAKTGSLAKALVDGGNPFISTGTRLRVWNLAEDVHKVASFDFPGSGVAGLIFHPDGKQLISNHQDGIVRTWDIELGKEISTLPGELKGFELAAISDDGRLLALVGYVDGQADATIEIWDTVSKERISKIQAEAPPTKMSFDPKGSQLAAGSWDNTIHLWDVRTGEELCVYRGHSDMVTDVAFHPHDPVLASCSKDETIKLWDLNISDQRATMLKVPGVAVRKLALADAGPHVAIVRDDRSVEVWNTSTRSREREIKNGVFAAIGPNGSVLATGDGNDLVLHVLDGDGRTIRCQGHGQEVRFASFSKDGERVVTVDERGKWIVWRTADGEKVMEQPELTGAASWVFGARFSPDGQKLLGHHDIMNALMVWDVGETKSRYESYDLPHTLLAAGMSEDGTRLVGLSGWGFDRPALLSVWEPERKEPLFTHQVAGGFVYGAAISPNGKRLFTAISGKGVQLWDVDSGLEVLSLTDPGEDAHALVLSANGHRLAGLDQKSETVWIWDATPLPEAGP